MTLGTGQCCESRGPLSAWTIARLAVATTSNPPPVADDDGFGLDLQLALYLAYEVHYGAALTFGVDEWDPVLIAFRRDLEHAFEVALIDEVGVVPRAGGCDVRTEMPALIDRDTNLSLSSHMETHGTIDQMRDCMKHRSLYQLKEADPHTFGIPRAWGRTKQLLAQIQCGEYGVDGEDRVMHSELFAQSMRALDLDDTPNAYVGAVPASALMVSNLASLFGLNRHWNSALIGHLAMFEMTSVTSSGRYSRALQRLGLPESARRFYDVHVLADAEHEVIALDMAHQRAISAPGLAADVLFGASCALEVEHLFARDLFRAWDISPEP